MITLNHINVKMMKYTLCSMLLFLCATKLLSQQETFDLATFTPPKGWKRSATENIVTYSLTNKQNNSWCQIGIVKSTLSKGSIDKDFESEWQSLVVANYKPAAAPESEAAHEADGWKIKAGGSNFIFNNSTALALLTTMSGFNRCVSIVATTNNQEYLQQIESFLSSVNLKKPDANLSNTIKPSPVKPAAANGFAFSTTNFDDGWTSTAREDWVEVSKGNIKVLIHYPNKTADAYNSVLMDGLKNAWNVLVAPRYSTAGNFEFKPITGWQSIEFAEADAVEKGSNKTVHVVLFKMNYSSGNGRYLEFITKDKTAFEQEFGAYHETSYGWEKVEKMANYNKFAVAASDLKGKWTSNFSGMTQYVNAYTGASAGADTHSSNQNFEFGAGNTYKWDLSVASGFVGNIKFQSVKSNGKFTVPNNWQVYFSDMEGKPKTYNVQFSCIKGARILWIGDTGFGKME